MFLVRDRHPTVVDIDGDCPCASDKYCYAAMWKNSWNLVIYGQENDGLQVNYTIVSFEY